MDRQRLAASINLGESCVLHAYKDSRGIWTIGWGHTGPNVVPFLTCTQAQADAWRDQDINDAIHGVAHFLPWASGLGDVRENVIIEMAFNMGIGKLLGFHHMLGYAQSGDYTNASSEMLNSLWASQVHSRANRLADMMRTGDWPNGL